MSNDSSSINFMNSFSDSIEFSDEFAGIIQNNHKKYRVVYKEVVYADILDEIHVLVPVGDGLKAIQSLFKHIISNWEDWGKKAIREPSDLSKIIGCYRNHYQSLHKENLAGQIPHGYKPICIDLTRLSSEQKSILFLGIKRIYGSHKVLNERNFATIMYRLNNLIIGDPFGIKKYINPDNSRFNGIDTPNESGVAFGSNKNHPNPNQKYFKRLKKDVDIFSESVLIHFKALESGAMKKIDIILDFFDLLTIMIFGDAKTSYINVLNDGSGKASMIVNNFEGISNTIKTDFGIGCSFLDVLDFFITGKQPVYENKKLSPSYYKKVDNRSKYRSVFDQIALESTWMHWRDIIIDMRSRFGHNSEYKSLPNASELDLGDGSFPSKLIEFMRRSSNNLVKNSYPRK